MNSATFGVGGHDVPVSPWISPKVAVRPSPGRGNGLFATDRIPAGEIVLVWGGRSYCDAEGAAVARSQGQETMQWDDDLFSRAGDDHDAFAVNHSCDPNVWLRDVFALTARRAVPAGEELTLDYATILSDETSPAEWECKCGAPECRGTITGADWRLELLQRRYAGHFTPILGRRIAEGR